MNASRGLTKRQRDEARQRRRAIARCSLCDPNGWVIVAGRAHRCEHPGTQQVLNLDQGTAQLPPTDSRTDGDSRPPYPSQTEQNH